MPFHEVPEIVNTRKELSSHATARSRCSPAATAGRHFSLLMALVDELLTRCQLGIDTRKDDVQGL